MIISFDRIPSADPKEQKASRVLIPKEFSNDPLGYFEREGKNVKDGEVIYDETGQLREDPTAVKDLPDWSTPWGEKIGVVAKQVNLKKGKVAETGDPFHEYRIMEIAEEFELPAARPLIKVSMNGKHLIVMEKALGLRVSRDEDLSAILQEQGYSQAETDALIQESQAMMVDLRGRYEAVGIRRNWNLKDMIIDIDIQARRLRGITPVDWERAKIDESKLAVARQSRSRVF